MNVTFHQWGFGIVWPNLLSRRRSKIVDATEMVLETLLAELVLGLTKFPCHPPGDISI